MKKKILLGLSGSVACSKAELFVLQNSEKFDFKFTNPECFLKNFAKIEWNVPTQGVSILLLSSIFTLDLISLAALFVNVTAIILLKSTLRFFTI